MLESPMLEWSRKLLTRFLKVSASSSQPRKGICTPNWCSSSRSPWRGTRAGVVGCWRTATTGPDCGEQRRRLIEAAVEAAEDPVEFGDAEGGADAGVGLVFGELAFEAGLAQAGDEGEPGGGLVVVGDVLFDDAAVGGVGLVNGAVPLPSLKMAPKR
jgi:hypothetical protein